MAYLENHFSDHRKNLCLGHSEVLFVRLSFRAGAFGTLLHCCVGLFGTPVKQGKKKGLTGQADFMDDAVSDLGVVAVRIWPPNSYSDNPSEGTGKTAPPVGLQRGDSYN